MSWPCTCCLSAPLACARGYVSAGQAAREKGGEIAAGACHLLKDCRRGEGGLRPLFHYSRAECRQDEESLPVLAVKGVRLRLVGVVICSAHTGREWQERRAAMLSCSRAERSNKEAGAGGERGGAPMASSATLASLLRVDRHTYEPTSACAEKSRPRSTVYWKAGRSASSCALGRSGRRRLRCALAR
jgi:hypothetical protein